MDEILLLLLRHGAHRKPARITTTQLGAEAGMSQQNASRRLLALERGGYTERKEDGIMLTRKAYDELAGAYSLLKHAFDGKPLEISGTVVRGFGEGRYYLSLRGYREQIESKLGFSPYPGTLNLRLDEKDLWKRQYLHQLDAVLISGFSDRKRTYGNLLAYRCRLDGHGCALLVPLRTHHGPDIIEVIGPFGIKRKLGLKDGARVRITV